jgi:glutamate N-acetyltransferase/amino-acid N-acetyltransferase
MATMLGIITTDAAIDKKVLQECTRNAVNQTFNCISVDGDTSTNDTVLVFANGLAKNLVLKKSSKNLSVFQNALTHVMHQLAQMIIEDGEGISRIVELQIKGAKSSKDAKMAANAIARSPLVKASWAGGDPNWGRLLSTIGHTEVKIDESKTDIFYNELFVVKKGIYSGLAIKKLEQAVAKRRFKITIDLHLGKYQHTLFVNDLTEAYVTFNKGEPSTPQPPPK